jgi:hypothetical protein
MLADVAAVCGPEFDGCGPSCACDEAGPDGAADSGASAVAGSEDGLSDCWALAFNVSRNEVVITQHHLLIAHQGFGLTFVENFESNESVAVVLELDPLASFWEKSASKGSRSAEHRGKQ